MKNSGVTLCALILIMLSSLSFADDPETIDLTGQWSFKLDPDNVGLGQSWFKQKFTDKLNLPGSLVENGIGFDINLDTKWTGYIRDSQWHKDPLYEKYTKPDYFKFPFWLQPLKYYLGPAWYQKQINIPDEWKDKYVTLVLERCHWKTTLWLDDKLIDTQDSLSTPHRYELGKIAAGPHKITLCVDNTVKINVGQDAHSVAFHTQSNWNGIIGDIKLIAKDPIQIKDVQVYSNITKKTTKVKISINNNMGRDADSEITIDAQSFNSNKTHDPTALAMDLTIPQGSKTLEINYPLGKDVLLWDEFSPNLYNMTVSVKTNRYSDEKTVSFGMREFKTQGTQFTINGRKTFIRGTLECCIFPLTGYPPTDVKEWSRIIKAAQSHGLNHFRFHSHCPPKAAFEAADQLGFYFQVEGPFWTAVGDGKPIDQYVYDECDRILTEYGNHPSFCLMAYGNEPGGKNHPKFLGDLVTYWKNKDPRRLYTSASGWPIIPQNQYHSTYEPRVQHWGAGLNSRVNSKPPETVTDYYDFISKYDVPVISHEIGQWCVYPNFEEIKKYTGVLKPKNFEIFRDMLKENHMADLAHDFLIASGKLQTLLYKEDIESALRTPGFGGFQLLDLHDFPGQGTALIGVLDPFWEYKGYVTAEEFRRFCNHTVLLAQMPARIFTSDETFIADIEIANFSPAPIENAKPLWNIKTADGKLLATGELPAKTIPVGNDISLGKILLPLTKIKDPAKMTLTVRLDETPFENDWNFWVYPSDITTDAPDDILITNYLDEETLKQLAVGKKVMLIPHKASVKGDRFGEIPPGFSSIFWNTAWTNRQPPHTLGILCDPEHPALEDFPTDFYSDWQWQPLIINSQIMILNEMPPKLKPIVRVIDDWFTNRRLGLVFEAKVGPGKLLICGIDLQKDLASRPVAKQLRHSLLKYMQSDDFKPQVNLTPDSIKALFKEPSLMIRAQVIKADSFAPGYEPQKAIDDAKMTFWHTPWGPNSPNYPHEIQIDLKKTVNIKGFTYLPRQDIQNALINKYEFYVSDDASVWTEPAAKGAFSKDFNEKRILFDSPVSGRFIRLVALSPANPTQNFTAVAELTLITE
jgi:hypothetical protein